MVNSHRKMEMIQNNFLKDLALYIYDRINSHKINSINWANKFGVELERY